MRTVYLGTAQFAAAVLRHLVADGTVPQLVVTRPDRPAGRGRKLTAPPVADVARELGIAVAQPEDVNDEAGRQLIADAEPDALLVCAYGALIREPLLSSYEILNVHPSLLPRWRGAAPIERAIIEGDGETGVSIMRLVEGLDCGPVCAQEREPIADDDSFGTLSERLEQRSAALLGEVLVAPRPFVEQDESAATYAEKITASDRILDPVSSAAEQDRLVRALSPHIGARVELEDGLMLGVRSAHLDSGRLIYDEVVPPGSRPMSWEEFQRGRGERE
jgi:methionyl-tRNA formyltransferase